MRLADDIRRLRDRSLAELTAAHDYHTDAEFAWAYVERAVHAGATFTVLKGVTGTVTTDRDLALRSPVYVARDLRRATFMQFLAIFESFFADLLRSWLTAYPRSLGRRTLTFEEILDASDPAAITDLVVGKEINAKTYGRPAEWFDYLDSLVKGCRPASADIDIFAEAKATRDVLMHNRGIANATYLSKSGKCARFAVGDEVEVDDPYHRVVWELTCRLVAEISDAVVARA